MALDNKVSHPKKTAWDYTCIALKSESVAWAAQNAIGALFVVLFAVVTDLNFELACLCACLFTPAAFVLSIDRSIGGRLFGGFIFLGCVLTGGSLGGGLATIAWQARGNGAQGFLEYLPPGYQNLPPVENIGKLMQLWTRIGELPLPPFLVDAFTAVLDFLQTEFGPPTPDSWFWILLILLYLIASIPFAVARGTAQPAVLGIVVAIATLFMGSIIIFAVLLPSVGLEVFWETVPVGYIKVSLVTAAAMVISSTVVCSKSAHDGVRVQLGWVLVRCGSLVSHLGSTVDNSQKEGDMVIGGIQQKIEAEDVSTTKTTTKTTTTSSSFSLQGVLFKLDTAVLASALEPSLPGLCAQPGASTIKYKKLKDQVTEIVRLIGVLEMTLPRCFDEIAAARREEEKEEKEKEEGVGRGHISSSKEDALTRAPLAAVDCLAAVASSCSAIGAVFHDYQPCSCFSTNKTNKVWRPETEEYWGEYLTRLDESLHVLVKHSVLTKGRASLLMHAGCSALVRSVMVLEKDAAIALCIPSETDITVAVTNGEALNNNNNHRVKSSSSSSSSLKERVLGNQYALALLAWFALLSGAVVIFLVIKATVQMIKGTKSFLTSAAYRASVFQDKNVQFAIKFYIGLALTIISIILLFWKGEASSSIESENVYNTINFFFTWQPVYFWITAVICLQQYVEATAFRAVLRTTGTLIGGTLGYCTMLNGSLANNPYFITSMVVLFTAVCSLLAPIKELRYALFLMTFTYNAVVVCQYFGCCDVAGDPKVYGGKVLSTALGSVFAIIVSWMFFPYYAASYMIDKEYGAMMKSIEIIRRMRKDVYTMASSSEGSRGVMKKEDSSSDDKEGSTVVINVATPSSPSKEWREAITQDVSSIVGDVKKNIELNTVQKYQTTVWLILATPPLVEKVLSCVDVVAQWLETAAIVLVQNSTYTTTNNIGDIKTPGPAVKAMMEDLHNDVDVVLNAAESLIEECGVCMRTQSRYDVEESCVRVREKAAVFYEVRGQLRRAFMKWQDGGGKVGVKWEDGDAKVMAWLECVLNALDACAGVADVLVGDGEGVKRRLGYLGWLTRGGWWRWCGFRSTSEGK